MAELVFDELKAKNAAVVYVNNDFGAQGYRVFAEKYGALGGTLVAAEAQQQGGTDFRTEITKIEQANPEAIVLISDPLESVAFIKQVRELGITTQIVATEWSITDDFLKVAGNAAENLIFYTSFDNEALSKNEVYASFRRRHLEKYGKMPEITSVQSYDAIMVAAQAIEKCHAENFSTECIKTKLAETQNYKGASGIISFDENGDVSKPIHWKIIKSGQPVPYG
jgi:branched-chain amino acid transport system substrate-binding protein